VGETYSGVKDRRDKVRQLESTVEFMCRRLEDRTGVSVTDATQVIGAAALVFSATLDPRARADQVPGVLDLIRDAAGRHLTRLATAGRLLPVMLARDQAPHTLHARETSAVLCALRDAQRDAQRVNNKNACELRHIVEAVLARLPRISEQTS
jgi:hypothetical protein